MPRVHGVLQMMIESVLKDVWLQNGAEDIIVDKTTAETLTTRLATLATQIAALPTNSGVDTKISTAINNLIAGAPGTYDTLKEIADYINSDSTAMTALNSAILGKVDKVDGKGLSTNDFTTALLNKLNAIAAGATVVSSSTTNGNIKINGTETLVYSHPTTSGNKHIPAGGAAGNVLMYSADGTAVWKTPDGATASTPGYMSAADKAKLDAVNGTVQYGTTVPAGLANGNLFIKIVSTDA